MKIDKVEKITVSKKLKESLNETWEMIRSKSVEDSDGFLTDYTMWSNKDGSKYVFVFGDNDLYSPNNTDWDWECDTYEEAKEWFEGYDNEWPEYDDEIDLDEINIDEGLISQKNTLSKEESLNEEMKKFHFEYMVDGVKSEQTISANNMQDAESLIKKQYTDKSVSITKREEIKENLKEDFDDVPDAPATPTENGVASVINTLIQDEWQAISQYNDAIVTIQSAFPNEAITNILKDIVAEENRHVGQLQAAMGLVSPATEEISFGEEEGVEQINSVPTATDMLQQTASVSFDNISLDNPTTLSDDEIDDTI